MAKGYHECLPSLSMLVKSLLLRSERLRSSSKGNYSLIMSVTQATVINTQVAVKYLQNVSSLLIDMSADNRTTTLGWLSVDISTDAWPICRPIWQPTHLSPHIEQHSTYMSAYISVDTRPICWLIHVHQSSVDRYDDRYIGRGVPKIHMILQGYEEFCRSRRVLSTSAFSLSG